jgi:pimeloyl-ACP methyl ester carboxylesterase
MKKTEESVVPKIVSTESIRPFQFLVPQHELDDLKRRILATKFPEKETVPDMSQGVQLDTVQKLARYWANEYDWRKIEAKINSYPNFITNIDGLDIHFIHVRSKHEDALPVIITHGWPGSIIEQMKIIEPLVDPTAHGGKASEAFHVVIPSMPGYGFSEKPSSKGWDPSRMGRAWAELMNRLGYTRYVAQGGDWGALVTEVMATQGHKGLIGIHTNMANAVPLEIDQAAFTNSPAPAGLSEEEKGVYEQLAFFYTQVYYAFFMGTRPQTLVALADSPVGLATFMLDHDARSLALITRTFNGVNEGLSRDDVLDNITLFWFTNTGVSAARLYWENKFPFFAPKNVTIPVAVSAFPDDLCPVSKNWAEKAYPNLIYYNKLSKGGHFAAWEQPTIFTEELRAAFKSLR